MPRVTGVCNVRHQLQAPGHHQNDLRLTSRYADSRARNLDTWLESLLAEEDEDEDALDAAEEDEERAATPLSGSPLRRERRRSSGLLACDWVTGLSVE